VPGESSSQLDGLVDFVTPAIFNAYDAYGWLIPAVLLTVVFFGLFFLACYLFEEIPMDFPIFRGPRFIFSWSREHWGKSRPPT
jgi:hypothetical protein